jgi:probable HAF family extracellular repeat protein
MIPVRRASIVTTRVTVIVVAIALFGDRVPTQSPEPTQYGIRDLGTLGGATAVAHDISELGNSHVGRAQTASGAFHAFADGFGGNHDLGTLGGAESTAWAVHYGSVTGQAHTSTGEEHAFFAEPWSGGVMKDLGTLGGNWSAGYGVENFDVVGASRTTGSTQLQAFRYSNGVMSALPISRGGDSVATAITGDRVVGYACTAGNASCRAFSIENGIVEDLGSLGGNSAANSLNYYGQTVGGSLLSDGTVKHAFLHQNGVMTDLGTLGGPNSEAFDINARGAVVGTSDTSSGPRAFIWTNGVMTDLTTLLPAGSGWVLHSASGISDGGQIVGSGTLNGVARAFMLTPPIDLSVRAGGWRSSQDSNLPRGVEAGRHLRFVMTIIGTPDPLRLYGARFTDTLSGPAEYVSVERYDGEPGNAEECRISAQTITCDVPPIDTVGFGTEYWIGIRTTGAGHISHMSEVQIDVPDTDGSNNRISEENYAVSLSTLALTPSTLAGGKVSSARVTLTGPAPSGDAVVRLSSSRPDVAAVPELFIVPFPQFPNTTRAFNIIPKPVAQPTAVEITATYGLVTQTQTLTVMPPALQQLYLTPTTIIGGCGISAGKIVLTGHAPAGGAVVPISNTNPKVSAPATVTVAAGTSSKTFTLTTSGVTTNVYGAVGASYGGVSQSHTVTVRPIRVKTLTLSPNPVTGGAMARGDLTLECPAPTGGAVVSLSSTNTAAAQPTTSSITIPAGGTTGSFSVRTSSVAADTPVTIWATIYGVRKGTTLTVQR